MRKPSKILVLLVTIITVLSLVLSGCGGNKTSGNTSGETQTPGTSNQPAAEEDGKPKPLKFTWYIHYDWFSPDHQWGERLGEKHILETMGVEIEFVSPNGAAQQKLATMIAADEFPDVICMDRGSEANTLMMNVGVPLDDWMYKYGNFVNEAGEETINMLRNEDGKWRQMPNWYISGDKGNGNSGWIINKKIYKELGEPRLETYDDLEAYLAKVKQTYPDVIPMVVDPQWRCKRVILGSFVENADVWAYDLHAVVKDNNLVSIFDEPTYKEGLYTIYKLFNKGYINQDAFTQTQEQFLEKLKSGNLAVAISGAIATEAEGEAGHIELVKNGPEYGYKMIWPIHKTGLNKDNIKVNDFSSLGWNISFITKSAKEPERIFEFIDWLTSKEGQTIIQFGPKGEYWDEVDENGYPIPNQRYHNASDDEKNLIPGNNWVGNTSFIDGAKAAREMLLPEGQRKWSTEAQVTVAFKTTKNSVAAYGIQPPVESEEGYIRSRLDELVNNYFAKMVFAKNDGEFEQQFELMKQEMHEAGYEKYLNYLNTKYQENLAKLGAK